MRNLWMLICCLLLFAYVSTAWIAPVASATTAGAEAPSATVASEDAKDDEESDDDEEEDEASDDDEKKEGDSDEDADEDAKSGDKKSDKDDEKKSAKKDAKKEDDKKEEKKERKTHKVEEKPLKIEVESDGTFVARDMEEVELDPEAWSEFEIVEIVPHGATVHKGEVLVKFDDEKLKDAINDLDLDLRLNELSISKAEQELPRIEKSIKDTFEQAERSLADAKTDYENYQETDREMIVKSLAMSLKSANQSTENAREELRQLEKMYEADDLTEETEEIILKRQRAQVEQAEFYLERSKLSHDRNLELFLPRNDIAEKEYLDRVEMAFERAKTAMEVDLNLARYNLQKSKNNRADSLEKHAKLTSDQNLLTIKAPTDGIVYYGSCDEGEWSDMANMIDKLEPENNAPTGSTLMTIVQPDELYVMSSVKEAARPSVKDGQPATIEPTATDSPKLKAKVSELSSIPVASDKFSMELDLTTDDLPEWLVAGMTCKVKVTTYEDKDALLVPKKAVHAEEDDEDAKYVWLVDGDDVEKRSVETGKTKGDDIQIVDGLEAGDVISLDDENEKAEKEDDQSDD